MFDEIFLNKMKYRFEDIFKVYGDEWLFLGIHFIV